MVDFVEIVVVFGNLDFSVFKSWYILASLGSIFLCQWFYRLWFHLLSFLKPLLNLRIPIRVQNFSLHKGYEDCSLPLFASLLRLFLSFHLYEYNSHAFLLSLMVWFPLHYQLEEGKSHYQIWQDIQRRSPQSLIRNHSYLHAG